MYVFGTSLARDFVTDEQELNPAGIWSPSSSRFSIVECSPLI
jgi:hypothetical protein